MQIVTIQRLWDPPPNVTTSSPKFAFVTATAGNSRNQTKKFMNHIAEEPAASTEIVTESPAPDPRARVKAAKANLKQAKSAVKSAKRAATLAKKEVKALKKSLPKK